MNALVQTLGWTMLHFLWQGAAVAGAFAALHFLLRHRSAQARYLWGCACLLLLAASPVLTAWWIYEPVSSWPAVTLSDTAPLPPMVDSATMVPLEIAEPLPAEVSLSWKRRIESALPWLVLAWASGTIILAFRLIGGWCWLQRLRWRGALPTDPSTQHRLDQLMQRMALRRPVRLVQSTLARVPCVLGWWRPIILMPAAMLCDLNPWQLDAILAHELAHVRRRDYLVNLLQVLLETLLFYHPAVWWISSAVRREREHACDDLAAVICEDRTRYARALLHVAEAQSSLLVPAATGSDLARRIRRLLGIPEPRRNYRWTAAGGAAVLLAAAFVLACSAAVLRGESEEDAAPTENVPKDVQSEKTDVEADIAREQILRKELEALDQRIEEFVTEKNPAALSKELATNDTEITNLETEISVHQSLGWDMRASVIKESQARLDQLRSRQRELTATLARYAHMQSYRDALEQRIQQQVYQDTYDKIKQLEQSRTEAVANYGELHPQVKILDDHIKQARLELTDLGNKIQAINLDTIRLYELALAEVRLGIDALQNGTEPVPGSLTENATIEELKKKEASLVKEIATAKDQLQDIERSNPAIKDLDAKIADAERELSGTNERINAIGQPSSQLRSEISNRTRLIEIPYDKLVAGDMNYNIVIRPGDMIRVPANRAGLVYIMGGNRPGAYNISDDQGLTLLQLIASSGGINEADADNRYIEIRRILGDGKELKMEVMRAYRFRWLINGKVEPIHLYPNDEIRVTEEIPSNVVKADELMRNIATLRQSIAEVDALKTPELSAASKQQVMVTMHGRLTSLHNQLSQYLSAPPSPDGLENVPTTPVQPEDLVPGTTTSTIGINDVVQVDIVGLIEQDEVSRQLRRVDEAGMIRLQLTDPVQAAGLTPEQLAAAIADQLDQRGILKDAKVQVSIVETQSRQFTVVAGDAREARVETYEIPRTDFRLLEAIAAADGVSVQTKKLIVVRTEAGE